MREEPRIVVPDNNLEAFFPSVGTHMGAHRATLKLYLHALNKICLLGCGTKWGNVVPHMHEGVVSRRDVMGWPEPWRVLIHTPYNCTLLCPDCNLGLNGKSPPSREKVFAWMLRLHGEDFLRWLESLPFKSHPAKGLIEQARKVE